MFLLMQNIFIVPAIQHGSRAKPLLGAYYCEYLNYNNWYIVVLWIHLAWPSSRNLCTSESIFKCRDIVHIFTCRARDKVAFTCTTAPKVGHRGKIFSHLTVVSLSFVSAKDVSMSHFVSS